MMARRWPQFTTRAWAVISHLGLNAARHTAVPFILRREMRSLQCACPHTRVRCVARLDGFNPFPAVFEIVYTRTGSLSGQLINSDHRAIGCKLRIAIPCSLNGPVACVAWGGVSGECVGGIRAVPFEAGGPFGRLSSNPQCY